jgi:hypothetical protein
LTQVADAFGDDADNEIGNNAHDVDDASDAMSEISEVLAGSSHIEGSSRVAYVKQQMTQQVGRFAILIA